jgi:hypothetical protein
MVVVLLLLLLPDLRLECVPSACKIDISSACVIRTLYSKQKTWSWSTKSEMVSTEGHGEVLK